MATGTTEEYTPLRAGLIVQRTEPRTETKGGIHIPEAYRDKTHTGTVLATGPDVTAVEVGAEVIFQAFGYVELMLEETPVIVLDETDVILVRKGWVEC